MSYLPGWEQRTTTRTARPYLTEREFHRQSAIMLIELHRQHKANDERYEAAECLEMARQHLEHAIACLRSGQ